MSGFYVLYGGLPHDIFDTLNANRKVKPGQNFICMTYYSANIGNFIKNYFSSVAEQICHFLGPLVKFTNTGMTRKHEGEAVKLNPGLWRGTDPCLRHGRNSKTHKRCLLRHDRRFMRPQQSVALWARTPAISPG